MKLSRNTHDSLDGVSLSDIEAAFMSAVSKMVTKEQAIAHMKANNWTPWLACRVIHHGYYQILGVLRGREFSRPLLEAIMKLPKRGRHPGDHLRRYFGPIF